jgi:hypothetical protein
MDRFVELVEPSPDAWSRQDITFLLFYFSVELTGF